MLGLSADWATEAAKRSRGKVRRSIADSRRRLQMEALDEGQGSQDCHGIAGRIRQFRTITAC